MNLLILKTKKGCSKAQEGMAIIAAIFLCLILTALGALAITISTGEIKSSVALVGEKKAFTATEKGIFRLVENFVPKDQDILEAEYPKETYAVDLANDASSRYTIGTPVIPTVGEGPETLPLKNFQQGMGLARYNSTVRGINTDHNTSLKVTVGLGYGPVDTVPKYR